MHGKVINQFDGLKEEAPVAGGPIAIAGTPIGEFYSL